MRAERGPVSRQTVYNVLDTSVRAGLLRWLAPAGYPIRYERCTGEDHHHLVCRVCGRIVDVAGLSGPRTCLQPAEPSGFALEETEVVFWGRCRECMQE